MINFIRRVEKINFLMISVYGIAVILSTVNLAQEQVVLMVLDLIVSVAILLYMDRNLKREPIVHRSPLYYYTFLSLVTITVYLNGGFNSELFPILFILPVLYTAVNFSRKGSTGIAIFSVAIMVLLLLQDPYLNKLEQTIGIGIIILALPQFIGLLVKEYVSHMKKLMKLASSDLK